MSGLTMQYAKLPETKRKSPLLIQRTKSSQQIKSPADRILFLQRTIGNQAVQRLIKSGTLQTKLKIGQPGDKYEQEADRVADTVMGMPESGVQQQVEPEEEEEEMLQAKPRAEQITPLVQVQRQEETEEEEEMLQAKPLAGQITPLVQRQVEPEEEEEEMLQAKSKEDATSEVTNDLESQINAIKGGGRPLREFERDYFEPRFGADFDPVRVHTDARAAESARAVNARAFTMGSDVAFAEGEYAPETANGRQLLAHELTHTIQQVGAEIKGNYSRFLQRKSTQHQANEPIKRIYLEKIVEYFISKVEKKYWRAKLPPKFRTELNKVAACMLSEGIPSSRFKSIQETLEKLPWKKCLIEFAKRYRPDVDKLKENEKQTYFKSDMNSTIAILLFEFATGTGPKTRIFGESAIMTKSLMKGGALEQTLNDFYEKNRGKSNSELKSTYFEYKFSPTLNPASISKSIDEHMEAIKEVEIKGTWSIFFLGGMHVFVIPKGSKLCIYMLNITGKKSLMLHQVPDLARDPKRITELGTIYQLFKFEVPLEPERLKSTP